jgi:large subunit ribosomal protein L29
MSKASELREMNDEQLAFALKEARQELFRLRFQAATEKLDAPSNLRKLRREIARILTIQRQRELAAGPQA